MGASGYEETEHNTLLNCLYIYFRIQSTKGFQPDRINQPYQMVKSGGWTITGLYSSQVITYTSSTLDTLMPCNNNTNAN
jgi:hypothetical protein